MEELSLKKVRADKREFCVYIRGRAVCQSPTMVAASGFETSSMENTLRHSTC